MVIHAGRSVREAEALADELRAQGRQAATVFGDFTDPQTPGRIVREAHAHFGQLDVLVNSAANFERAAVLDFDPETWDRVFAVNTRAPFFAAQTAATLMPDGGVIVNIVDHLAFETIPALVAHGAAKAALVHITHTLARALAPRIRVNAVAPGLVAPPPGFTDAAEAQFLHNVPLGRIGTMEDVAQAVCYLIDAPYVTGSIVRVDGGRGVAF